MMQKHFAADDPAIPMNYLGFVFRTLGKDGYEVEALLAGTGLTAEQLEDPNFCCDFWSHRRFYKNAIALTNDPHLGAKLAQQFETNYIGLPAYAAMNAVCLGDALKVLNRFLFLTFPAIEFTFRDEEVKSQTGEVAIRLRLKLEFGDIAYFVLCTSLVICDGILRQILRAPQAVSHAELTISEPEGWVDAASFLNFPVRFNALEHHLFFPADLLHQPLPGADPINHKRLVGLCEQFAAEASFETTVDIQVVTFLKARHNLGVSMSEVAAALGYSERSLRRQLERCGVSFRKLVDQVRETRARWMLANTSKTVEAIAYELGFNTSSNFARSFKRWLGVTPGEFRDGQRARRPIGQK
ncbi:MAG: AraC family transcriptional regulator ligand-binding domain-containing protein [Cyanobacteriota bacterium]|nr:AraC family transcriptional regulator ligand-binding domain-containing protein [Cyanobacteriota bacterium]